MKKIVFNDELEPIPFRIEGNHVYVPYYSGGVQAGFPSPAEDFDERRLSLDEKYLTNPNAIFIVKVKGNSMYPTLHVGDVLIVRSDKELVDHKIAILSVNNTAFTVKRYDKKNNALIADNKNFETIKLMEDDTLLCLGVVQHLIRDL